MELNDYLEAKLFHEVHTSERKSFRSCRRKWHWSFRDKYYPNITAKPLEFGTAYHKAMETYYNPETWDEDRLISEEAILDFIEVCATQRQNAINNSGDSELQPEQEIDYQERVELGKGMLRYYFKDVAPYIDKGWRPVSVEQSFAVPIKHPITGAEAIWCKCETCWNKYRNSFLMSESEWEGLPVVYEGRMDMMAQDDKGFYWIFDWKTTARIMDTTEYLYLDDQISSYVWAMKKLGLDVRGFQYHEQHKSFPTAPVRNKTIRMGRAFSVAKNAPVEYDSYLTAVMTEDKEAYEMGLYDEYLTYLKEEGVTFWQRHKIIKSPEELASVEYNIGLEVLDMLQKDLLIYPSPNKFSCDWCAFRQPCMEKNANGDFQFALDTMFEKREHYYVRSELSTEIKG